MFSGFQTSNPILTYNVLSVGNFSKFQSTNSCDFGGASHYYCNDFSYQFIIMCHRESIMVTCKECYSKFYRLTAL